MKRINTLMAMFLIGTCAFSQTKKADRLFDKWDYYEAAKLYKSEAEKKPSQDVNYKLGYCYQKMLRYADAKAAYDKVNGEGRYDVPEFYYNYGLVLRNNELYDEAEQAFRTYETMRPGDERAAFNIQACETAKVESEHELPIEVKGVNTINNEFADFSPVIYKDGIVFASSRKNAGHNKIYGWTGAHYYDLLYAEKNGNVKEFKGPGSFDKLVNKKYSDGPATFSKNYDTIFFNRVTRDLKGTEKRTIGVETNKIYMAVYEDGKWKKVTPFPYNTNEYSVATPCLSKDGSRLYFSSDMPGGFGNADLYYCYKSGETWSAPVNLGPNINTSGNEKFPSMDADSSLYFVSDGYLGYGGLDVCVAKNSDGNFEHAQVLKAPLNSAGDEYGIAFVEPGRSGYVSSVRKNGNGDADIYYFTLDNVDCINEVSSYVIGYRCEPVKEVVEVTPLDSIKPITNTDMQIEKIIDLQIYFDFDKSFIRADAKDEIDSVYRFMKSNPDLEVEVDAHADSRGTDEYNYGLTDRRANSTIQYLNSKGILVYRMKPKSYGESKLVNGCTSYVYCDEDQHQANRRVQFIFRKSKNGLSSDDFEDK